MKKISAVLLVLVLVGSVAFAGFTGSATAELGYDLDTGVYGFSNGTSVAIDVALMEALGEAKGEGDIYADIAASLTFSFSNADAGDLGTLFTLPVEGGEVVFPEGLYPVLVEFDFDHATIVGPDWSVGILGVIDPPNFATSAIDSYEFDATTNEWGFTVDEETYAADLDPGEFVDTTEGLEVGYMGYTLGLGLKGNTDDEAYHLYGAFTTPEYEAADGLKVQLGAAGALVDNVVGADSSFSVSAKAAYDADLYSALIAGDLVYDNEEVFIDVAVAGTYDMVSFDAYYATDAMYDGDLAVRAVENLLSAKVAFTVDPFTIAVTGADLVNDQDLSAEVSWVATDAVTLTVNGGYVIGTEVISAGVLVAYTADQFTATAEMDYGYSLDTEDATFELDLDIESTTLVDGATLYAGYYAEDMITAEKKGAITFGVEIAF